MDKEHDAADFQLSESEGKGIAENIQRKHPGWMIVFGVYSRQFVAFPLFKVNKRTILAARYPDALIDRMVGTEQAERQRQVQTERPVQ
jgi:hypothetical protein